jgi:hypothetical protein
VSEIQNLVKEAQLFIELVDRKAQVQKTGSYSERNPAQGKMKTCPYCRIRERDHKCNANIPKPVFTSKKLERAARKAEKKNANSIHGR